VKLAASTTQEGFRDFYTLIQKAIATRTVLRCRYESGSARSEGGAAPPLFQFKPYALFFNQRAWYVVGFHGLRGEVRMLKLNRFSDMQPTTTVYEIPRDFSVEKHLGNAWRMMRGPKRYAVVLQFDASFAETISDTSWHRTQEFEHLPDGSLRFTCNVDGLEEIMWWVLSMGSHCVVKAPAELVERVQGEAQRMLALYRVSVSKETGVKKSASAPSEH
jgi:predicted DNA-binding transcriptional regulator YafY